MPTSNVSNKTTGTILFLLLLVLVIGIISISASSTSTSTRSYTNSRNIKNSKEKQQYTLPLHGIERDIYVQSAPLIIAVSCKDGIAIVAAHPSSLSISNDNNNNNDNDNNDINDIMMDPLLYYRHHDDDNVTKTTTTTDDDNNNQQQELVLDVTTDFDDGSIPFVDLPVDFGGPYRINDINDNNIVLSCGWRADCQSIYDYCTSLIDTIQTYEYPIWILNQRRKNSIVENENDNSECDTTNVKHIDLHPYQSNSYRIASDISYYMAQCAVSERVRTLSCVTLLVSTTNPIHLQQQQQHNHNQNNSNQTVSSTDLNNNKNNSTFSSSSSLLGNIWFIDSTGAYPVRALCIGGGVVSKDIIQQIKNEIDEYNKKSITTIDSTGGSTKLVLEKVKENDDDNDDEDIVYVSDYINQRLLQEYFTLNKHNQPKFIQKGRRSGTIGFEDLTVIDGLKRIILILANKRQLDNNSDDDDAKLIKEGRIPPPMQPPTIPILNKNTRLELAIVRPTISSSTFTARAHKPAFVRMLLSDLFP